MKPSEPQTDGLREAHKRDKAARIREAGLALLKEKGFEGTTTREVAQRAGIATGTLFLYVKTKEELVDFIFRDEIARVSREALATVPSGDIVDQLHHLFRGLLEFYGRDVALSRVMLREVLFAPMGSPTMALTFDFLTRAGALVEAAQQRGDLSDTVPAQALTYQAFFLYAGAVLGLVNGVTPSASDAAELLRGALTVHFLGLRPPPGGPHKEGRNDPVQRRSVARPRRRS